MCAPFSHIRRRDIIFIFFFIICVFLVLFCVICVMRYLMSFSIHSIFSLVTFGVFIFLSIFLNFSSFFPYFSSFFSYFFFIFPHLRVNWSIPSNWPKKRCKSRLRLKPLFWFIFLPFSTVFLFSSIRFSFFPICLLPAPLLSSLLWVVFIPRS